MGGNNSTDELHASTEDRGSKSEHRLGVLPLYNSIQLIDYSVRGWLTVAGAFSTFFCSVGFINAFGVFQAYYKTHQLSDHSDFDISWIGSFSTFALFGGAPFAGILVDRFGPRVCSPSDSDNILRW